MEYQHRVPTHIETYSPLRHAAGLVRLYEQGFVDSAAAVDVPGSTSSVDLLQNLSTANGLVCVADGIGVVAGLTSYTHRSRRDTRIIANVVTDLRFQRQGLARALLQAALHQAKSQRVLHMALQVDGANAGAINLYESCGFYRVGEIAYLRLTVPPFRVNSKCTIRPADKQDVDVLNRLTQVNWPEALSFAEPSLADHKGHWWMGQIGGIRIGALRVQSIEQPQIELMFDPKVTCELGRTFLAHVLNQFWGPTTSAIVVRQSAHAPLNLRVLRSCGFALERCLVHMKIDL